MVVLVIWSTVLGLGTAVAVGQGELLSVSLWLTFTAVGVLATITARMLTLAAVEPARFVVAWRSPLRARRPGARSRVRDLRSTETAVTDAVANARAHNSRLRPRLTALADHYLPIRRGVDRGRDAERADQILGDVAWLIDGSTTDRAPTLAELDRFMDVILTTDEPGEARTADCDLRIS